MTTIYWEVSTYTYKATTTSHREGKGTPEGDRWRMHVWRFSSTAGRRSHSYLTVIASNNVRTPEVSSVCLIHVPFFFHSVVFPFLFLLLFFWFFFYSLILFYFILYIILYWILCNEWTISSTSLIFNWVMRIFFSYKLRFKAVNDCFEL